MFLEHNLSEPRANISCPLTHALKFILLAADYESILNVPTTDGWMLPYLHYDLSGLAFGKISLATLQGCCISAYINLSQAHYYGITQLA